MIVLQTKIILLLILSLSSIIKIERPVIVKHNQKELTLEVTKKQKDDLAKRNKIKGFIKLVKPKYSDSYIAKIVDAIMISGKKYNVDPYVIASTAYVESEFSMSAKNCIGIMQLLRSTARYYDPKKEYNPYTVMGNIAIGTKELKHHLNNNSVRSTLPSRETYRNMYRKYNGSYLKNTYARKALLVQYRLERLSLSQIKTKIKEAPLWR
jgi:soluble lytic murein transglycosylase-like protein